jgi:hypothetical protein
MKPVREAAIADLFAAGYEGVRNSAFQRAVSTSAASSVSGEFP